MNRILLLTDFSDNATQAISYAFDLWRGQDCKFFILNIQKTSEFTTDDLITAKPHESVFSSIIADNKTQLETYVSKLRGQVENENFEIIPKVDYDAFTDAVNQAIDAFEIEYVVLGTNGASGPAEVIFGSNTLQVIRRVNCPTIVVPEGFAFRPLKDILYSQTDDSIATEDELLPFLKLIQNRSPQIHLLGIQTPDSSNGDVIKQRLDLMEQKALAGFNCVQQMLENLPVPEAIIAYEQLKNIDLHVFSVQRKSFLKRFLFGSDTGQISHRTKVPLLVLHHQ